MRVILLNESLIKAEKDLLRLPHFSNRRNFFRTGSFSDHISKEQL